jgi:hypothetical protein
MALYYQAWLYFEKAVRFWVHDSVTSSRTVNQLFLILLDNALASSLFLNLANIGFEDIFFEKKGQLSS